MRNRDRLVRMLGLGMGLAVIGCSGGDKGGGPTGPTPAILLTLSRTAVSIIQGQSATVEASVSRTGGFTGDVAIAVEGVPAGVTGAVANVNTTGGVSTGTVTIAVATTVAPGNYNIVVRAAGSGVSAVTVSAALTVEATPAIAISVGPTLSVNQGASGPAVITIARTNFTGNVTFALEGAPTGVTGTFVPAPAPGASTTLTVQVAAAVAIASYNLTIRATGAGVTDATAPLTLTINPAPAVTISLTPAAVTVNQGASGQSTVTITRTNYTGNVNLALEGNPANVTGTFVPSPAPAGTSTLTLQVGAPVAPATYHMTVRATGDGITAATAALDLTVTIPASYTMTASSPSITVGSSGPSIIALARTNFTGDVSLTFEGAPTGVTGSFSPATVSGTTSTLTISVAGNVAPGAYQVAVKGTATGLADVVAPFTLTVAPVQGGYSLSITPTGSVSVAQGGGVAVQIAINRTGGFTGEIALSVSGAPNGLTTSISPANTSGNVSALSITAAGSLATNTYPLTVTGTTPGLADRTANISAAVAVPNISLDFGNCGAGAPIWLAVQNGANGDWVQTLAPGGSYKTKTTQTAVALAFVTTGFGNNRSILVQYMTATELQNSGGDVLCGNPILPSRTATATTANLGTFQIAYVSFGGAQRVFSSPLPGGTLSGILSGAHDLVSRSGSQSGGWTAADRLIIRRDLNPPNGGSLGAALDFTTAEAFAPSSATITVTGFGPGEVLNSGSTTYHTGSSCLTSPLWSLFIGAPQTSFTAFGVPAIKQRATDYHGISVSAVESGVQYRSVTEYTQALANRTVALPSSLPIPTVTTLPAGYQRLQFAFTAPSDLASIVFASYGINVGRSVFLSASSGWLAGTSVSLSLPAFGSSANWDDAWGPPVNPATTNWTLSASGASGPACSAGGRITGANRMGTF